MSTDAQTPCTCPSGDGSLRWPCPVHAPSVADAPTARSKVDALALVLLEAWKKAEPDSSVTKYPTSYLATFVDMARAALAAAEAQPVAGPQVKPVAWRFQFPTSARWHYTEHGPHEASRPGLKWEPLHAAAPQSQPRLRVRLVSFPESNGKRNWTAMIARVDPWGGLVGNCGGITVARGEFWNRVAYEAERAKLLIGERDTEPCVLDYGDDIQTPEEWAGEARGGRALRPNAKLSGPSGPQENQR